MSTATVARAKKETEMTLKEYFAQNPDIVIFKDKVEEAKKWMKESGITGEYLARLRESSNGTPPPPMPDEEKEDDTYNYIWSLILELGVKDRLMEQEKRTAAQLRKELGEKDRLIAALRKQLESRRPLAA